MNPERALAEEREAMRQMVGDLRAELEGILAAQDASPPDDEHDVEGSSVGYERARAAALLAWAEVQLAEADAAMARKAAGRYGRCEVCRHPIGDDRLAALPTTRRCVTCAAAHPAAIANGMSSGGGPVLPCDRAVSVAAIPPEPLGSG